TGPGVARRAALPVLALAVQLVAPGRSAAQGPAPAPAPVRVAEAFTAAWNAHDLPAVLALFAPDAVVRERWGAVPPYVWDTRDPQVVHAYLRDDAPGLVWVTGRAEIAAWAAARFAAHSRLVADAYRAAGDTVGWSYRAFADAYQLVGVGPAEGEAEAVVRGGRIAVLSLVQTPASVLRRENEGRVAAARAAATRRAAPAGDGPSVRLSGPPRGDAEPTGAAWPLALSGLALLTGAAVALRRRRPS
ncbi:MAG TPA: nuclear transport factor 2 family protein, partial [Chloroflexota bacterium]|nr:nuclear transport factor 2 family protein [Chloroflexota bacterium]